MALNADLPPRYELRYLEPQHAEWTRALICHSNLFYNKLFAVVYSKEAVARCYASFLGADYFVSGPIAAGYSLGVFDTEYKFKRPESEATGGKLYWDLDNTDVTGEQLLEQMDFPLVSVAMSRDSGVAVDMARMKPIGDALPAFGQISAALAASPNEDLDPEEWQATGPGQILARSATATRRDYEGQGLMKKTAHYVMRMAAEKGFRGLTITATSSAINKIWSNPPEPFKAFKISEFQTQEWEVTSDKGEKEYPLRPADQLVTRLFVALK